MWSVLAILHYNDIPTQRQRVGQYKQYEHELNYDEKDFPMNINGIPKFEKNNKLAINVIKWVNRHIKNSEIDQEIEVEDHPNLARVVNLLLLQGPNDDHFAAITNLDRL